MTTPLSYPERVAVARLHAMLELLPTALDKRLGAVGITSFEHTLLDTLEQNDAHRMRMSELARKTNATLPRLSRVASSLERRGLIERAPCPEDGRATNAVLTPLGVQVHEQSQALYASAVRELVLEGLGRLPGDGVAQLTDLTYAVLTSLDTEHPRGAQLAGDPAPECTADPVQECDADPDPDPDPECDADPDPVPACAADPAPVPACAADPAPACDADPVPEQSR